MLLSFIQYHLFILLNVLYFSTTNVQTLNPLTLHVLDNSYGGNAVNMSCKLYRQHHHNLTFELITSQTTDINGRATLLDVDDVRRGIYRIWLDTKSYYESNGKDTFWPFWETTFRVRNTSTDYHIPVALSQFGFQTYRGS